MHGNTSTRALHLAVWFAICATLGCGGSDKANNGPGTPGAPSSAVPQFSHVIVVVEENHSYSEVIGSSAMPYLNELAAQYGLATNYFANTHPSIGNYFMLTTGQLVTNDDAFPGTVDVDNVFREIVAAGKSWKVYAESIPSAGYLGGDVYPYVKHHNPAAYLSDVVNDSAQAANLVPITQLQSDITAGLPNFALVIPNMLDDAHDGSLDVADAWLKSHIGPVVMSSDFQSNGLLIIVFDESNSEDVAHGGGQVAAVIVSSKAQKGYQSKTFVQHQSTLRLICESLGLVSIPGAANNAPSMAEFF